MLLGQVYRTLQNRAKGIGLGPNCMYSQGEILKIEGGLQIGDFGRVLQKERKGYPGI